MTIAHWTPPVGPTRQEQFILKRLGRVRKLLGFLRLHRHELFDAAFQDELIAMYRTTGAGKEARPPAMMAMAILVQGYLGISDAEMIEWIDACSNGPSNWRSRPRHSTTASCPRLCAWRSIRVRWRVRDASRTRSTCWPMRRAMSSAVPPACSGGRTRKCAGKGHPAARGVEH